MSERSPELQEVARRAVDAGLHRVFTLIPAIVTSYDASARKASCQPLIKRVWADESGDRQVGDYPIVSCVPVVFPGGGGFTHSFPVSDGSLVIDGVNGNAKIPATMGELRFSMRSLDKFLSGKGQIVDPEVDHEFALTDGIFTPELYPFGAAPSSTPSDHAFAGVIGGVGVHYRGDKVTVGDETGSQKIAMGQKTDDVISTLWNLINQFFGASATVIDEPGNGAPSALQAALMIYVAAQVALNKLPPPSIQASQGYVK